MIADHNQPSAIPQAFTDFVGIDWSGASAPGYRGVAVACCRNGNDAPVTVWPPVSSSRRIAPWSRQAVHDWLLGLIADPSLSVNDHNRRRWLVGIDCAFSLPWQGTTGWFDHLPCGADGATVQDLWDLVEEACTGIPDFLGSGFALDPRYRDRFRHTGIPNPGQVDFHRRAELACDAAGLGQPQSPYRLVGAKQVGKAGLAGMRMVRSLKQRAGDRIAVWPFDRDRMDRAELVLTEMYPRLFLRRAGFGNAKIRDGAILDRALTTLGSGAMGGMGVVSDHDSDALVSAAGLRLIAAEDPTWSVALTETDRQREGWIIGVPGTP